ncbi:uncharacterized protein [Patagioenas fasciata]|uniref:uncharacterized protein n=1 Tax=Patagioenas fasciata TaxID=372321 RepID=UPI003A9A3AE6
MLKSCVLKRRKASEEVIHFQVTSRREKETFYHSLGLNLKEEQKDWRLLSPIHGFHRKLVTHRLFRGSEERRQESSGSPAHEPLGIAQRQLCLGGHKQWTKRSVRISQNGQLNPASFRAKRLVVFQSPFPCRFPRHGISALMSEKGFTRDMFIERRHERKTRSEAAGERDVRVQRTGPGSAPARLLGPRTSRACRGAGESRNFPDRRPGGPAADRAASSGTRRLRRTAQPPRGQRCNGALIPDTAEEMSLCASLTLTGGTDVTLCKTEAPWSFAGHR